MGRCALIYGFVVWSCVTAAGCGAAATPAVRNAAMVHSLKHGLRVVALPRPTPGVVWLSLFVDAGARDAADPQTAGMVAHLMAAAAGQGAVGIAYPDAIEVSVECTRKRLSTCLRRLAHSLSIRHISAVDLRHAQVAFDHDRQQAQGDDRWRVLAMALQDLLGESQAKGFLPFGHIDEVTVPKQASIEKFAREHLGPQRVALVASGDVTQEILTQQVEHAFDKVSQSTTTRAHRGLTVAATQAAKAALGDAPLLGLVFSAPNKGLANNLCQTLKRRLAEQPKAAQAENCQVTPVQGGAIAMVNLHAQSLAPLLQAFARARQLVEELNDAEVLVAEDYDLADLNRATGLRLSTQQSPHDETAVALGAGLLSPTSIGTPHAIEQQLAEVASWAHETVPAVNRDKRSEASIEAAHGIAHLQVQAREGQRAAIVVSRAPGASQDPLAAPGRAALLATVAATHCDGLSTDALAMHLRDLNAQLVPVVAGERFALSMSLPAQHLAAGLRLTMRCTLSPSLATQDVSDARLALRARLLPNDIHFALLAETAERVAPDSPGQVAPLTSSEQLSSVDEVSLRVAAQEPGEVRVAVVAPIEDRETWLRHIAYELRTQSLLRARNQAPSHRSADKSTAPIGMDAPAAMLSRLSDGLALLVLRSSGDYRGGAAGAQAAAVVARAIMTKSLGIACVWHAGGVTNAGGWAAVALRLPAPLAEDFTAQVEGKLRALASTMVAQAVDDMYQQHVLEWSTAAAGVEGEAQVLAGVGREQVSPSRDTSLTLAKKLLVDMQSIAWERDAPNASTAAQ